MKDNDLIKAIDSINKIEKDKYQKEELKKEPKKIENSGFAEMLKIEQDKLKEIEQLKKEKKKYQETLKEIYEKELNNNDRIRRSI